MAADILGWMVADGFGWLRMVSGGCGWFQVVSGGFEWFVVLVVTLTKYGSRVLSNNIINEISKVLH